MSSSRFKIAPTDDELRAAESLLDAVLVDNSDERQQNLAAWKETNMPAVRNLLRQHFDMMLGELMDRMESDTRRQRFSQSFQRQFPRFEIAIHTTYQGVDGTRMVREATEPTASSSTGDADWDYDDGGGRSPNDDRSDSMNTNSDAYEASADNRSDQMNPNNDAYWSSRR